MITCFSVALNGQKLSFIQRLTHPRSQGLRDAKMRDPGNEVEIYGGNSLQHSSSSSYTITDKFSHTSNNVRTLG